MVDLPTYRARIGLFAGGTHQRGVRMKCGGCDGTNAERKLVVLLLFYTLVGSYLIYSAYDLWQVAGRKGCGTNVTKSGLKQYFVTNGTCCPPPRKDEPIRAYSVEKEARGEGGYECECDSASQPAWPDAQCYWAREGGRCVGRTQEVSGVFTAREKPARLDVSSGMRDGGWLIKTTHHVASVYTSTIEGVFAKPGYAVYIPWQSELSKLPHRLGVVTNLDLALGKENCIIPHYVQSRLILASDIETNPGPTLTLLNTPNSSPIGSPTKTPANTPPPISHAQKRLDVDALMGGESAPMEVEECVEGSTGDLMVHEAAPSVAGRPGGGSSHGGARPKMVTRRMQELPTPAPGHPPVSQQGHGTHDEVQHQHTGVEGGSRPGGQLSGAGSSREPTDPTLQDPLDKEVAYQRLSSRQAPAQREQCSKYPQTDRTTGMQGSLTERGPQGASSQPARIDDLGRGQVREEEKLDYNFFKSMRDDVMSMRSDFVNHFNRLEQITTHLSSQNAQVINKVEGLDRRMHSTEDRLQTLSGQFTQAREDLMDTHERTDENSGAIRSLREEVKRLSEELERQDEEKI